MLESLIVATAESVIISCGKSIYQRVSLCLKKRKIKNALKERIESDILSTAL